MWKAIGDNAAEKVQNARLGKKVKISVDLPNELLAPEGKVRTYYVVRVHEGVAEILPTTLNGKTITFETDKFSTYSVWYTETDAEKGTPSGGEGHTPKTTTKQTPAKGGKAAKAAKTGDYTTTELLAMLVVLAGAVILVTGKKRFAK